MKSGVKMFGSGFLAGSGCVSLSKEKQDGLSPSEHTSWKEKFHPETATDSEGVTDNERLGQNHTCGQDTIYRCQLEEDVKKLQQQLQEEKDLHDLLESSLHHRAQALCNFHCHMPAEVEELLASIALLEVTITKLEEETVFLHYQLSQERNERRLLEYRSRQSPSIRPSKSSPSSAKKKKGFSPLYVDAEDPLARSLINDSNYLRSQTINGFASKHKFITGSSRGYADFRKRKFYVCESTGSPIRVTRTNRESCPAEQISLIDGEQAGCPEDKYLSLWQTPNHLSEEMVRCMRDIFMHLGDPETGSANSLPNAKIYSPRSPLGNITTASSSSFSESSSIFSFLKSPSLGLQIKEEVLLGDNAFDPYHTRGKVRWADIGKYESAVEVSWMSVGRGQLEYAADALRKFRVLVEQLAKVNPGCMTHNQRLAFWINIYNALMMHAYLAYGVPKSDLKLLSLMQKAAYTVGRHSFNAVAIEYAILKMRPPMHRPQIALLLALHKFKLSEEQSQFALEQFEPLATFSLSCGVHSSPAVRVVTAESVHADLQEAFDDYIRASVGINTKGKLLIPKLIHCFAKGTIQENEVVNWICQYLSPSQVAVVQSCLTKRRQRFLGSRDYSVIPFDVRFRYLFLRDKEV